MSPRDPGPETAGHDVIELAVTGMTCAACAARIERRLNREPGLSASVNYATERARIIIDPDLVRDRGFDAVVDECVATVTGVGYGASRTDRDDPSVAGARIADLRRRLRVATILGAPVLALSMIPALQFRGWQWVALGLALPVSTWSAWPFHRAMWMNLRHRQATMDTLVSVGVIAATGWSLWALTATEAGDLGMTMSMTLDGAHGAPHIYLEVASTVVAFLLGGRYYEARAKRRAGEALRSLLDLGSEWVSRRAADGKLNEIDIAELAIDDEFLVRPGERVATDGVVIEGSSEVDNSVLTGESVPVAVGPGDRVIGAAVNSTGLLVVRATAVGSGTQLAQMARLVNEAQSGKAPIQRLADRVSAVFVPIVILLALATTVAWLAFDGSTERAFSSGVAVLIIACPCALGLATPTALLVGTGRGARLGILIRGPEVLESTRQVDTLVLDKTGTITTGSMEVVDVRAESGVDPVNLIDFAASVEVGSAHPIAAGIVRAASAETSPADGIVEEPGRGVSGTVDGRKISVGRVTGAGPDGGWGRSDVTSVEVSADGAILGWIALADQIRDSSPAAVASARAIGLEPIIVSGDRAAVVDAVADHLGIERRYAGVLPVDKLELVRSLAEEGRVVAMVGDGVNDAAALAAVDLGLAMGSGTDVAIAASDITLVREDLGAVVDAIRLSRRTLRTIRVNLIWAFGYNVAAIPLAATGRLSPVVAGAAMALSSVFVVSNSLRLRRFR
ncbi:MAG: cadmium-translocating P-type ATPase [Actinobacteria bacterium]|nr:cadmium-translocating P-type ATPase [Actinomycetota bacterium]